MANNNYLMSAEAVFKIAHDLGAPFRHVAELTRIVLAQHTELPTETREMLSLVSSQGARAAQLLEGLVSLQAAEQAIPAVRSMPVKELQDHVPCEVLGDAGECQVDIDPGLLAQALAELIQNARAYGQFMKVAISRVDTEIAVQVIDGGDGIPENRWEEALLPFGRLDLEDDEARLGLGLARASVWARSAGGRLVNLPEGVSVSIPVS